MFKQIKQLSRITLMTIFHQINYANLRQHVTRVIVALFTLRMASCASVVCFEGATIQTSKQA